MTDENKIHAYYFPDVIRQIPAIVDYDIEITSKDIYLEGKAPQREYDITFTFTSLADILYINSVNISPESDVFFFKPFSDGEIFHLDNSNNTVSCKVKYYGGSDYEGTISCEVFGKK